MVMVVPIGMDTTTDTTMVTMMVIMMATGATVTEDHNGIMAAEAV
jgi:hypothetical protein